MKRSLTLGAMGVVALLLVATAGAPRVSAQPDDVQSFLAAAALQPAQTPSGLAAEGSGPIDPSQLAQAASLVGGAADPSVLLGGYQQQFVATDLTAALFGKPLAAGDTVIVYTSAAAAAAALANIGDNGQQLAQQLLGGTDFGVSIANVTTLTPPSLGDQAQELELTGTVPFGGQTVDITIDVLAVQRGAVQYGAVAVGLQGQRKVAESMAQAIDANVQANLALLPTN